MRENWRWIDVVKLSVMLQPDMKIPAPALAERMRVTLFRVPTFVGMTIQEDEGVAGGGEGMI